MIVITLYIKKNEIGYYEIYVEKVTQETCEGNLELWGLNNCLGSK